MVTPSFILRMDLFFFFLTTLMLDSVYLNEFFFLFAQAMEEEESPYMVAILKVNSKAL